MHTRYGLLAGVALFACACSSRPAVKAMAVPPATVVPLAPAGSVSEQQRVIDELNSGLAAFPESGATPAGPAAVVLKLPSHLLFAPDALTLTADGVSILTTLATALKNHGSATCEVAVFTDALGGELDNETLARRRAEGVVAQLVAAGVASPRLQANGAGATKAVAPNDSVQGRRQNRRIEVTIRLAAGRAAS